MTKTITLSQKELEDVLEKWASALYFDGRTVRVILNVVPGDRPGEPKTVSVAIIGPAE